MWQVAQNSFSLLPSYFVAQYVLIIVVYFFVIFVIVQTGLDHFRSEIQRSSRHSTRDRFGFFRNTDIGYFGNVFLRKLWDK